MPAALALELDGVTAGSKSASALDFLRADCLSAFSCFITFMAALGVITFMAALGVITFMADLGAICCACTILRWGTVGRTRVGCSLLGHTGVTMWFTTYTHERTCVTHNGELSHDGVEIAGIRLQLLTLRRVHITVWRTQMMVWRTHMMVSDTHDGVS